MNKNLEIKQKFADESNIDINLLNGNSFDSGDFSFRRDPYDFRIGSKVNFSKGVFPAITHVYIRSPARFSNSLLQLINAYNFAVSNKIKTLVLPDFWYLPLGLTRLGSIDIVNLDKNEVFMPGPYELAIDGNYFYRTTLDDFYNDVNNYETLKEIKNAMLFDLDSKGFSEEDLTIHLRSGDVFEGDGANAGYGQPPFCFYKYIIEEQRPEKIQVIYEDKNNPVISELIKYLDDVGIKFECFSSTLSNDIDTLLKAKNLVVGRGTFLPGITSISNNISKVYYFESGYNSWGNTDISILRYQDITKEYVKKVLSSWKNTDKQRKTMITYSITNIGR